MDPARRATVRPVGADAGGTVEVTWGLVDPATLARIVVVSPHFDDAALGAAHLIAGHPGTTVITVLGGRPPAYPAEPTSWDACGGFLAGDDVVALRREEDRSAMAFLEADAGVARVPRPPVPGQGGAPPPRRRGPGRSSRPSLAASPTAVFLPLGLANPDHALTHDAGLLARDALARSEDPPAWFCYEDHGYKHIPGIMAWRVAKLFKSGLWPTPAVVPIDPDMARKRAAIELYKSQVAAPAARPRARRTARRQRSRAVLAARASPAGVGDRWPTPSERRELSMKGLLYGVRPDAWEAPDASNPLLVGLARTPMKLVDLDEPHPARPGWVMAKTRMTGICGSEAKQVFMDFGEANTDSPLANLFTFPTILGHEVVAERGRRGPRRPRPRGGATGGPQSLAVVRAAGHRPGVPVVRGRRLQPVLALHRRPLGAGHPHRHLQGRPRWLRRLLPRPPHHALPRPRRGPRRAGGVRRSLRGLAALGHPSSATPRGAGARVRRRCPRHHGHGHPARPVPRRRGDGGGALPRPGRAGPAPGRHGGGPRAAPDALIEQAAAWSGGVLQPVRDGLPMAHPGGIDVVYDTIGKPETFEVGVRLLKARGTLVKSGVHGPGRWEYSPLYFKEITWVGSNAFGVEEVDGVRKHGIAHFLDLADQGTGRPRRDAHPHVPTGAVARGVHGPRRTGAQRRHQGGLRLPLIRVPRAMPRS